MILFTSDHHLGHENILTLGAGRPFKDLAHMHSIIIKNWWETVAPDDIVYLLGDIAMGSNFLKNLAIFKSLPGTKIFLRGNHDKIFPKLWSKEKQIYYTKVYEDNGFIVLPGLHHEIELEVKGQKRKVLLSHIPYKNPEYKEPHKLDFARPIDNGLPLIHGHTHSRNNPINLNQYHVGVDAHNFTPVKETKIIKWLETI